VRSVLEVQTPIEKTANKLPAGRSPLLAFVADADTEKSLRDCLTQLGHADGSIMRGGIAKAIEALSLQRSPNILFVDISGIDLPVSYIHELAEVCEPGVMVIAIGDRNDVGLYRDLIKAGLNDYVVKPLTPQLISNALTTRGNTGEVGAIHPRSGPWSLASARAAVSERRPWRSTSHGILPTGRTVASRWSISTSSMAIARWR